MTHLRRSSRVTQLVTGTNRQAYASLILPCPSPNFPPLLAMFESVGPMPDLQHPCNSNMCFLSVRWYSAKKRLGPIPCASWRHEMYNQVSCLPVIDSLDCQTERMWNPAINDNFSRTIVFIHTNLQYKLMFSHKKRYILLLFKESSIIFGNKFY